MTAGKRAVVCRVAKEEIRHRLRDLCTAHISQMLRDIAAEGRDATRTVGITTIRRIHSCLGSALGDAVKGGLVQHNAAVRACPSILGG